MPRAQDDDEPAPDERAGTTALRREVRIALGGLLFGALLLPFLVYAGGAATLGPYEGGLGPFLGKLYGDLAHGSPAALALILGPYVLGQVLRVVSRPLRRSAR